MHRTRKFMPGEAFGAPDRSDQGGPSDAYAQGYEAGLAKARSEHQLAVVGAIAAVATEIRTASTRTADLRDALATEAAELALTLGETLSGIVRDQAPLAGIERLVRTLCAEAIDAPVLTIRVEPALTATVQALVETCTADGRRANEIVVLAEPALSPGDCIAEWSGGGARFVAAERRAAIDAMFERFRSELSSKGSK